MIVIPCLNEEKTLLATCLSLGFGELANEPPRDCVLILVDNGSEDRTYAIMESIRQSNPKQVFLAHESQRGYVPPRHHGVNVARALALHNCISEDEVLILQADADTIYQEGYLAAMIRAAGSVKNCMLEGVSHTTPEFKLAHSGYFRLISEADGATERFMALEEEEIVIDDKVAGYKIGDYYKWGGHQREYDAFGDEIHAETSRLYLRAKTLSARRVRVADALAFPSRRKVELDPLLYFATSGFPREDAWKKRWQIRYGSHVILDDFDDGNAREIFKEAVFMRRAHNLILFGLIPAYLTRRLKYASRNEIMTSPLGKHAVEILSSRIADVALNPGRLFEACFSLIESHPDVFEALFDHTDNVKRI